MYDYVNLTIDEAKNAYKDNLKYYLKFKNDYTIVYDPKTYFTLNNND